MSTYIALLRGINVGGNNLLPMKDLVAIMEDLGCEDVRTYIQSGNAVFRAKGKLPRGFSEKIATAVQRSFGFKPEVLVLSVQEWSEAMEGNPFPSEDGKALHCFFLESTPKSPDLDVLEQLKANGEDFALKERVFFLYTPAGLGRSKLAIKVEKALGVAATARNWNTVRKLADMARGAS